MKHIAFFLALLVLFAPAPVARAQSPTLPSVEEAKRRADQLSQDAAAARAQADAAQADAARARQNAAAAQSAADQARAQAVRLESEAATQTADEAEALARSAAQTAALADATARLARAKSDAMQGSAAVAYAIVEQQSARLSEISASLADTGAQLDTTRRSLAVADARFDVLAKASIGLFALLVLGTIAVLIILRRQSILIARTIAAAAEAVGEARPAERSPVVIDAGDVMSEPIRVRHVNNVGGDFLDRLEALFDD